MHPNRMQVHCGYHQHYWRPTCKDMQKQCSYIVDVTINRADPLAKTCRKHADTL